MLETCTTCGDETGRAGAGDDSLYLEDGTGPYCERCFEIRCLRAEVEELREKLSRLLRLGDDAEVEAEKEYERNLAQRDAEVERLTYELKRCGDTGYRLNEAYVTECDSVDRLRAEFERWKRWDEALEGEL